MSSIGNKEVFAKNLNHYMEMNGKDRAEICKELGFKYSTFTDWVNANKYPRIDKIELLANYFGIQKSDLIEDKADNASTDQLYSALEDAFKSLSQDARTQALDYMRYLATREKSL